MPSCFSIPNFPPPRPEDELQPMVASERAAGRARAARFLQKSGAWDYSHLCFSATRALARFLRFPPPGAMEGSTLAGNPAAAGQSAAAGNCQRPPAAIIAEPPGDSSGRGPETHVRYFERCQHDIVPGRHADMGSSCCALFASAVVAGAMADGTRLASDRLEALLVQCVSAWDATREVAGSEPAQVLQAVLEDFGIAVKVNSVAATPETLLKIWSGSSAPRAYVLTAIPRGTTSSTRPTGDTFAVCHLRDGVHLIDSHRHHTAGGTSGMLWARSSSLSALHSWLFSPSGLLEQLRCRADLFEIIVVEDWWSTPTAAASGIADEESGEESEDVVLVEPPLAAAAREAVLAAEAAPLSHPPPSGGSNCSTHVRFDVQCDRCRWTKHGTSFMALSEYTDAVTFGRKAAVTMKPATSPADFAIGCSLCARYVAAESRRSPPSKWARFKITGACVCKNGIRKHLATERHRAALRSYAADPSEQLEKTQAKTSPLDSDEGEDLGGSVPRGSKFADAIRGCLRGDSGHSFSLAQHSAAEPLNNLVSTGVFRDESRGAHRKMLVAAAAVLDEGQRAMLKNAVRIAFCEDDRDQNKILRIRVVWEKPQVGCAGFFGALLRDYGFDATDCSDANVEGFKRLCSNRVRAPQEKGKEAVTAAQLDEPLWEHVRRAVFCGATDGAASALLAVRQMAGPNIMPNLRYQFRDKPHTTRTCMKLAYNLCPESEDLRTRLITGKQSFARRVRDSRRFKQLWKQKQVDEPDALWNVLTDLGYAEQRFDSRSKPMARFLLKLGPALEVLQVMSRDLHSSHQKDAKWARELLERLAGPAGFVKLVLFAIDTDFAVAAHKLIRLQDQVAPDVSKAAEEVQQCVDTCRVLFHEGRVFDKAANGTYTNHLLQGFYGVSRELVLCDREQRTIKFGWPAATEDGLLKDAVAYAKKLHKAVILCFQYNFPMHAWRTRFQAFCLSSHITHATRREHIQALATKEGVDPARAWTQFFEAFPYAMRYHRECGDTRQSWISYLEACCRQSRHPRAWRPFADCIVPLVLTYLGIMDGSSDVERNFSTLQLVEARRAKRHHGEQFLQDLLKLRLEAPEEFRKPQLGAGWERGEHKFVEAAQRQYAKLFGTRQLASRSMTPVSLEVKRQLFVLRRPRWQHAPPRSGRTCAARTAEWEDSVQRMLSESAKGVARKESFAGAARLDLAEDARTLAKAEAALGKRRAEHEAHQIEAERADRFAVVGPPMALKLTSLLEAPPKQKMKSADAAKPKITAARAQPLKFCTLVPPSAFSGVRLPSSLSVYCSKAAQLKHVRAVSYLRQQGRLTADPARATHKVLVGKAERQSIAKASRAGWSSMSELVKELRAGC